MYVCSAQMYCCAISASGLWSVVGCSDGSIILVPHIAGTRTGVHSAAYSKNKAVTHGDGVHTLALSADEGWVIRSVHTR